MNMRTFEISGKYSYLLIVVKEKELWVCWKSIECTLMAHTDALDIHFPIHFILYPLPQNENFKEFHNGYNPVQGFS